MDKKTLVLCSYGLRPEQITLETITELKTCDTVFAAGLNTKSADLLKTYCANFKSLPARNMKADAERVFRSFPGKSKVGFLTFGNPFFVNDIASLLCDRAESAGIAVKVLGGVSSFDMIANILRPRKYPPEGLRIVDMSAIPDGRVKPAAGMDSLFFCMRFLEQKGNARRKERFIKSVTAAYGGSHPAVIIKCSRLACLGDKLVKTTVAGLKDALAAADEASTVFIPARKRGTYFIQ
jgi:hypothetical protein